MSKESTGWNKSTIVLAVAAALGLAALIVLSKFDDEPQVAADTQHDATAPDSGGAPVYVFMKPAPELVKYDDFDKPLPVLDSENIVTGRGELKTQTVTVELALDRSVEYKALMEQGDSLVYSWKTDGGPVYFDFHAHDDVGGPDFFTRYVEGEGSADTGSIVAPYSGQHGWYWLNISDGPITITLEVAGFYNELVDLGLNPE